MVDLGNDKRLKGWLGLGLRVKLKIGLRLRVMLKLSGIPHKPRIIKVRAP